MLKNTFCHVPGIGIRTEAKLWEKGIYGWEDFMRLAKESSPLPSRKLAEGFLAESLEQLKQGNPEYFNNLLPAHLSWRMFPEFRTKTAYLDIETTGLDVDSCDITTIALYDGQRIAHYIQGKNLETFQEDILKYRVIVTYNGKTFDVPFLERYFRIKIPHPHIDLRYVLHALGYKGGLKNCEVMLNIDRGELKGVDGIFSVLLWADYVRTGNIKSLETLLAYNIADVVNLEILMVLAYNMNLRRTPFEDRLEIDLPTPPALPFEPHLPTIERIRYGDPDVPLFAGKF
jgi:uncharacterized protein